MARLEIIRFKNGKMFVSSGYSIRGGRGGCFLSTFKDHASYNDGMAGISEALAKNLEGWQNRLIVQKGS